MSRRIVEFYCVGGFKLNSFELNLTIARRINSAQAILNAHKRNFKKLYPGNCIVCFILASQVAATCINTTSIAKCYSDTYRPNLGLNHSDTVVTYSPNYRFNSLTPTNYKGIQSIFESLKSIINRGKLFHQKPF